MNYFQQMKAFRILQRTKQDLQSPAIALWYALMGVSNDLGQREVFTAALSTLAGDAGLSVSGVKRARNALAQKQYIQWRERPGRLSAEYHISDLSIAFAAQCEPQSDPQTVPQTVPQTEPQAVPNHKQDKTRQNKGNTPLTPQGGDERFDAFWAAYPRKVGKEAARKAYAKIKPTEELHERILAAVAAQERGEQWRKNGGQFIPHPATWLNQGRWDDEVKTVQPEATSAARQGGMYASAKKVIEQQYSQRDYNPSEYDGPTEEELEEARRL